MPAPVALFAYRRPEHLERTLRALRSNPEASQTELYVFSDGPKDAAAALDVEKARRLLAAAEGFSGKHLIFRDTNFGLAKNITQGVSQVLTAYKFVIVLEDDIVVSPFFLQFMNDALALYRLTSRVGSISGYCYPASRSLPETFFVRGADCWGWATWRDRWSHFNADGLSLLADLRSRELTDAFDLNGAMAFTKMLEDQIAGRNNSWAIRWRATCYLKDLLILYPGRSLAHNIGNDGSGTHSDKRNASYDATLSPVPIKVAPIPVAENPLGHQVIREFFLKQNTSIRARAKMGRRFKAVAGQFLPSIVFNGLRRTKARDKRVRYSGLHELDRQIEKYLNFDTGYFIELGANDGRFQSNTLYYEQYKNWRGILIEPAPNLYLECRRNRSAQNYFVCAACVSFAYKEEFVKIVYSNSMSVSLNVETDIGDSLGHAELGRPFLKPWETIFTFGAPARTLNSIVLEAAAPKLMDLLSLDVEGSEIEVLSKGVDHDAFKFRYMLIECRDIERLQSYVEPLGYRYVEKFNEHDYFFELAG